MAMIAGAAGFAAAEAATRARIDHARAQVKSLAAVAEAYLLHHPGAACPTASELRDARLLNRGASTTDPWDRDYVITCDANDVNVRSGGPDAQLGSDDDISVF
jgi:hypothetical protein